MKRADALGPSPHHRLFEGSPSELADRAALLRIKAKKARAAGYHVAAAQDEEDAQLIERHLAAMTKKDSANPASRGDKLRAIVDGVEAFSARVDAAGDPPKKPDPKPYEHKYDPSGVQKMIEKDKRIGKGEAKKIHALLKGWRGDAEPTRADKIAAIADGVEALSARIDAVSTVPPESGDEGVYRRRKAGMEARKAGKPRSANPYKGGHMAEQWLEGYDGGDARADASISAGKTYKQLAAELRRSADSDRSGRGKKPLPGYAHGVPDEWSIRSAVAQEKMAAYCEAKAAAGGKYVTEEDVAALRQFRI